jgi:Rod binding domain-containing protein
VQNSSALTPLPLVPTDILTSGGNRLEDKIRAAQNSTGQGQTNQLKKVSQEFEAIFMNQLLKVMRETIEDSGVFEGGFGKSIYTELFDQEISMSMARRGTLGISDILYKSLSERAAGKTPDSVQTKESEQVPEPSATGTEGQSTSSGEEEEISDLQLPVHARISSAFGMRRDPISHQARFHKGLDLAAPEGMKVVSALPGTVVSSGYENGYGNTVLVQHEDGLQTRYGHLGTINVKAGDVVNSATNLGTVGSTGRSTGPHLHFEVIRMGTPVDPLAGLNSHSNSLGQGLSRLKVGG